MTPPLGLPVGSVRAIQFLVATGTGTAVILGHAFGAATPDPEVLLAAVALLFGGPLGYARVRSETTPPPEELPDDQPDASLPGSGARAGY